MRTRRLVFIALLTSAALMLHIAERLLPIPQLAPGIKLGLANIITLFALNVLSLRETAMIVVMRTVLASIFGGGVSSFLFSFVGGVSSMLVMWVVLSRGKALFSLGAVSIIGAVTHNTGQLLVASLVVANFRLYFYLPILLASAIVTGFFVGLATSVLLKALNQTPLLAKLKPESGVQT